MGQNTITTLIYWIVVLKFTLLGNSLEMGNSSSNSVNEIFKACLEPKYQDSRINCSVKSSGKIGVDFDGECLSPGVIRFLGEFDVLDVNCVAPYHLDFDFDGFQPTEAIKVNFWKELSPNATHWDLKAAAYHLDLKIYSNAALYKFHTETLYGVAKNNRTQNSTSKDLEKLEYPRTGRYVLRKLAKDEPRLEINFFFEEPNLEPSFMLNQNTQAKLLRNGNLLIPCRPSHAAIVNLYRRVANQSILVAIPNEDLEPWRGFEIPYNETKVGEVLEFECRFEETDINEYSQIVFTYPHNEHDKFGINAIKPQVYESSKVTVNHEANIVTRDPITVNITCVILTQSNESFLSTIGCENAAHMRLVQEFILPKFKTLSYYMSSSTTHVGEDYPYELKIYNAFQTGITFCTSGNFSRVHEYASGLNRKIYQLDYGTDYASLPHTSPPKEVHIDLQVFQSKDFTPIRSSHNNWSNSVVRLVPGTSYTFSCRIDLFTVAKTILWEVQFKNGTLRRVKVDYNFHGEFSYLNLTAEDHLVNVYCSAPFWNNDKFRTDELQLVLGDDVALKADDRLTVLASSFSAFVLLTLGAIYFMFRRIKKNQKKWTFTKVEILEFENGNPSVKTEAGLSEGGHHLPYDRQYEILEESYTIDFENVLGSGEFGIVYGATLNRNRVIAAKAVKPNVEKSFTKALLSELKIMIYLGKHENIIEFLGASTVGLRSGSVYVFLEICALGSLENFLRANRHHLLPEESPYTQFAILSSDEYEMPESYDVMLSLKDLFTWSYQIAQGMDFLSSKNVIHGDLATRNVLLTENKVAKICDFGLSRRLHNYRTYAKNPSNQPLPWPWMAPESLRDLTFSSQSDVWAFGITAWEIFSLGESPYPGMTPGLDFVDKLRNGLRNLQTPLMPDNMYKEVMKECWRYHPEDRPSFNELCFTLETILSTCMETRTSLSSESGIASSSSGYVVHTLTYSI